MPSRLQVSPLFGQSQPLHSCPALNLRFSFSRQPVFGKLLTPNQLHRSPRCREFRSHSPVVFFHSLSGIGCNSRVQRSIPAPHHVAKPLFGFLFHAPSILQPVARPPDDDPRRILTSPLCAPYACGTCYKTFSSPDGPGASSCSSSSCSCGSCNRRTVT